MGKGENWDEIGGRICRGKKGFLAGATSVKGFSSKSSFAGDRAVPKFTPFLSPPPPDFGDPQKRKDKRKSKKSGPISLKWASGKKKALKRGRTKR